MVPNVEIITWLGWLSGLEAIYLVRPPEGTGLAGVTCKVEAKPGPQTQDLEPSSQPAPAFCRCPEPWARQSKAGMAVGWEGGERMTGKQISSLAAPWAPGLGDN